MKMMSSETKARSRTAGTTILDNSGSNSFNGGVNIAAGTLQIGNNDTIGNLPDGQSVVDNSSLVFKRTDNRTNSSVTWPLSLSQTPLLKRW